MTYHKVNTSLSIDKDTQLLVECNECEIQFVVEIANTREWLCETFDGAQWPYYQARCPYCENQIRGVDVIEGETRNVPPLGWHCDL